MTDKKDKFNKRLNTSKNPKKVLREKDFKNISKIEKFLKDQDEAFKILKKQS